MRRSPTANGTPYGCPEPQDVDPSLLRRWTFEAEDAVRAVERDLALRKWAAPEAGSGDGDETSGNSEPGTHGSSGPTDGPRHDQPAMRRPGPTPPAGGGSEEPALLPALRAAQAAIYGGRTP